MLQQKKPAKNKLKTIKKFLNGENVSDLLSLPVVRGVVTWFEKLVHEGSPSWADNVTINDKPVSIDEYDRILEEEKQKGNKVWQETKTYKDKEIEGISYSNPDNVPEPLAGSMLNDAVVRGVDVHPSGEPANEPIKQLSREQLHRLYLDAEMKRMNEQEIIDLRVRDKMIWWSKVNNGPL